MNLKVSHYCPNIRACNFWGIDGTFKLKYSTVKFIIELNIKWIF